MHSSYEKKQMTDFAIAAVWSVTASKYYDWNIQAVLWTSACYFNIHVGSSAYPTVLNKVKNKPEKSVKDGNGRIVYLT